MGTLPTQLGALATLQQLRAVRSGHLSGTLPSRLGCVCGEPHAGALPMAAFNAWASACHFSTELRLSLPRLSGTLPERLPGVGVGQLNLRGSRATSRARCPRGSGRCTAHCSVSEPQPPTPATASAAKPAPSRAHLRPGPPVLASHALSTGGHGTLWLHLLWLYLPWQAPPTVAIYASLFWARQASSCGVSSCVAFLGTLHIGAEARVLVT